jgi:hypothetical protein
MTALGDGDRLGVGKQDADLDSLPVGMASEHCERVGVTGFDELF